MVPINKFKPGQEVIIHPNFKKENLFSSLVYPGINETMRSYAGEVDEIVYIEYDLDGNTCRLKNHPYVWNQMWLMVFPEYETDVNFTEDINGIEELI